MTRSGQTLAGACGLAACAALTAMPLGFAADSLSQALGEGEAHLVLRYRLEQVDQEGFADKARASTVLGRLNFRSGSYQSFSLFAEVDTLQPIGSQRYNSAAGTSGPNRSQFPVVADPDGTEVNQAWVQYAGLPDTQIRLGRVGVNFDNQRFVGGVAWRQNEQTYDGVLVTNTSFNNTTMSYLFIDNVNRIFGDNVAAGDHDSSSHMLNIKHSFAGAGTLSGYAYLIDNKDAPAFSTGTIGLRWAGSTRIGDTPLGYTLEFASQQDRRNNPVGFDASYFHAEVSFDLSPVGLFAGTEVLGGDDSQTGGAFRAPLATLHKFNGWADVFLTTPNEGLEDWFVGIKGQLRGFNWRAVYHDFSAQEGGADFGREANLIATTTFRKNYALMLKFADFNSASLKFRDTQKLWLMLTATF